MTGFRTSAVGVLFVFVVASGAHAEKLKVAVTLSDVLPVVNAVAGNLVDASYIMPPGSDPHSFTLSAQQQERLATADFIIYSHSGFQHFEEHIRESFPDTPCLDWPDYVAEGAALGDFVGYEGNPHGFWLDNNNAQAIAKAVAKRFASMGVDKTALNAGLAQFTTEMEAMKATIERISEACDAKGRVVVSATPCIMYSIRNVGFEIGGVLLGEGAGFTGGKELKDITDKLKSGEYFGVVCPISMKDAKAGEVSRQIAKDAGCPVIYIQFLGVSRDLTNSFLSQGYYNAAVLAAADRVATAPSAPPVPAVAQAAAPAAASAEDPSARANAGLIVAVVFLLVVVFILAAALKRRSTPPSAGGAGIFDDRK